MKYNILIIDNETETGIKNLLKELSDKNIVLVNDETTLISILEENSIHIIVLNSNILELDSLIELFQLTNNSYEHIPIIVIGDGEVSCEAENHFSIFDCTNEKYDIKTIYSLINYCKTLYTNELQHESKVLKLLYTDPLTQLPNRVKLIKDLQNENIGIDSLTIIDINDFKNINDFFGHRVGDKVLKSTAKTIEKLISKISPQVKLYKLSSDVFCITSNEMNRKTFEEFVLYVLGAIEAQSLKEKDYEINLRATAGISFSPHKNKLITADLALQSAKKQYKSHLVFYEELNYLCEYENNMLWACKLKKALANDNLRIYYQPMVSSKNMKITKYECLVRMYNEDTKEITSPHFFLDIAKKSSQYFTITKLVIETAFKQFDKLDYEFSINISFRDIEEKRFLKFIEEQLKKYNVANKVVWEILEDEKIKDYDMLLHFIKKVKALGCKVSLDDFGTGYSNFEHILKMDLDYLKIDATLIKMVHKDPSSFIIVKTIVDFAKNLNILTIAEYVENEEIYKITKEMGVDFFQGYYFSKPLKHPLDELEATKTHQD